MSDLPIHAVMYRDFKRGTLCGLEGDAEQAFATFTDLVTCPGCRAKIDGGPANEVVEPTLRERMTRLAAEHEAHHFGYYGGCTLCRTGDAYAAIRAALASEAGA